MTLKDLECLTQEVERLMKSLKEETNPRARLLLMERVQALLETVFEQAKEAA